ncbi:hypothetical protein AYL99_01407 [Fonsecaea erecta]|uniref:Uncharacterized protein n=1 Tax=Fonsecaea erecta TaxID=1367422 RepID=A0A179A2S2_9EURO|nr:hypothetical protein AYL99_01407 [Fonsecaea erecta]OAP65435.1 hypothetical protein AYL99_01407 [Fonsecaea erecta]
MQASPSKARAQALASHSWSLVHTWLARLYHPCPVPAFERSATTLRALQGLMAENIAADRVRELLFEAKAEELATGEKEEDDAAVTNDGGTKGHHHAAAHAILSLLEASLAPSAQTALDSLASSVVLLGGVSSSTNSKDTRVVSNLTSQIVTIPHQTFAQESQLVAIDTLTATLRRQITETQKALAEFVGKTPSPTRSQDDPSSPTTPPSLPPTSSTTPNTAAATAMTTDYSHLHNLTLQHQRETKQLTLKSAEYKSRIDALERQLSSSSRTATAEPALFATRQQESLDTKKRQVEALESRIRQFHGLPPDVDTSRAEVRRAEGELDLLRRRRDALFEAL